MWVYKVDVLARHLRKKGYGFPPLRGDCCSSTASRNGRYLGSFVDLGEITAHWHRPSRTEGDLWYAAYRVPMAFGSAQRPGAGIAPKTRHMLSTM